MSYTNISRACVRVKRTSKDGKVTIDALVTVSGSYDPGYAPRPCSDPDHPAYSDPGSPPDFEVGDVVEVEDVEIDCDEDSLSKEERSLLEAIEHAWEVNYKEKKAGNAACAREHQRLAGWLEELFACRHGLGPWADVDFTREELRELEEAASCELESEREAALEAKAEADWEERRLRRRFGDDW